MNSNKKFFSKIGFNYLILGISAIIFQIIIINIFNAINSDITGNYSSLIILSSICNYVLPFPLFYYLMKKLEVSNNEEDKLSVKKFITYLGITMTLMWIGNLIGLILTTLIGGAIQNDISNPVQELINSTNMWLNLILISIIGPIFEEILFRKILIDRTLKYGARVSIILSAVLFGLFHGNLNQFFYALIIGGFFAYVYIKTGKIIYPILLHQFANLMGSVVSMIVTNSVTSLESQIVMGDLAIVIAYLIILLILIIIGIIGITNYNNAKFNGEKTKIQLKNPFKTMFINPGMLFFIAFFIFEIIRQLIS